MKPIAVTMGCPVGVGPEILLRFFETLESKTAFPPVVLGDYAVLSRTAEQLRLQVEPVHWDLGNTIQPGTVPVMPLSQLDANTLLWGKPTQETSIAMADYIRAAVHHTQRGDFAAMVTCPISKKALNNAGVHFPGHTEMLAHLTDTGHYRMMLAGSRLRVVLVTIHEPLAKISELLTISGIQDCIRMTARSLRKDFSISSPRIAVAALNPHAGEQGMFGREEIELIQPALDQYDSQDCPAELSGPWPPDTIFYRAANGEFDAVVCMYHDQGLIPFKLLHFQDGVNVTLGLPIVRTSVDHGTAYDIAGQGKADPSSLRAAWRMAAEIAKNRTGVHRHGKRYAGCL
ncbi:MAG: 4-hydroxythreonine-4-phosphate dehydrogenase PdxA [Candidatus Electrothrix aestuarii]|uniref:4-hydroxythreonine-4-phosphate dehydrogenase n=1 Tax=Candidatus Electrothrix aestuarii TaxID=3062594 RepID=A0AAU8LVH7_9BACT|nr:4-hydroxythreonine-4-phosphate dehydrogenase PdxA [Candidatus Electrothrix aestuarii]